MLLVDDPPLTGRTLLSLAREVPGQGGVEVLVPVLDDGDVRALREEGITVTVLPRERWLSTLRLEPDALAAALRLRTPGGVRGAVAGWVSPGIFGDAARTGPRTD